MAPADALAPTETMVPAGGGRFPVDLSAPVLPLLAYRYSDAADPQPRHFLVAPPGGRSVIATDNTPSNNRITDAGATLGRVLFYERRLSSNRSMSCASCHQQALGFADSAQFSLGVSGERGEYHAPALGNARFYTRGHFFWDERAATLEAQVSQPIADPVEMNLPIDSALRRLSTTTYYAGLYRQAFGTSEITLDRTARALAQFIRAMRASRARYDRVFEVPPLPDGSPNFAAVFTPQEARGQQLFTGAAGCARCHQTHAQLLDAPANTGLDLVSADTGAGRGRFKSPSLRNVAVRRHFMHDGRFTTLEQVIAFYDHGIQPNVDLDPRLRTPAGRPRRLRLTVEDQGALVAFLKTLTDESMLTDVRFSDPFRR